MNVYKNFAGLKHALPGDISRFTNLSKPIKLTVLSLSLGVALIGALAMYFRKRRKRTQMIKMKLETKNQQQQKMHNGPTHNQTPAASSQHQSKTQGATNVVRSSSSSFRKLRSVHLTKTQTPNGVVQSQSNLESSLDVSPICSNSKAQTLSSTIQKYIVNSCVIVKYGEIFYPGVVTEVLDDQRRINFLKRHRNKRDIFVYPEVQDIQLVYADMIVTEVMLIPNGNSLREWRVEEFPSKKNMSTSVDSNYCGSGDVGNLMRQRALSASLNSLGGVSNNSSSSTVTHSGLDTANMTSADLCQLGMENLSLAISYWEDAVMKLSYLDDQHSVLAIPDEDTANLQHRLENLLDLAYRMQENYERLCERQVESIAIESALAVFTERDLKDRSFDDDSSDQESFVSATDMAHLTDLDFNRDILHHVPLYEAGMLELKYGNVPCRSIRPEMVQCLSDVEFLAKLHGIRLAFHHIFQEDSRREWFKSIGRKIIGDLLTKAERDVDEFYTTYDKMMQFINVDSNWPMIEEELRGRGVRVMSFYDIVLDFILMDAFDDLANPPSTVLTVVQNRWLSNGFKETALATAVWSVLKAKRSLLKFNDGFIAHFYSITEHTSPLLAWGFLGPDSDLKELCNFFKDLVLGFIQDIFNFKQVRYTTVEALAEDIIKLAQSQSELAAERLKCGSPDVTPVASYC